MFTFQHTTSYKYKFPLLRTNNKYVGNAVPEKTPKTFARCCRIETKQMSVPMTPLRTLLHQLFVDPLEC
jgi:hypothetical protein